MFIEDVVSEIKSEADVLGASHTLNFVMDEHDIEKALVSPTAPDVIMSLKKGVLYAQNTIIITQPWKFLNKLMPDGEHKRWNKGIVSSSLKTIYGDIEKTQGFRNTIHILPSKIVQIEEEWEDEDNWFIAGEEEMFEFTTTHKGEYGIDVRFTDPIVANQIFETSVVNVWLPHLANIPLDILLKLRSDEQDSFARLHYVLQKLIADSKDISSNAKLKELFQHVDYEVRTFEAKMNTIRKSRALKEVEMLIGFSIMGLCLTVPSDVGELISATIGAFQGKDFVGHIFRIREQINDLHASDFYVPWLLTQNKQNKLKAG